MAGDVVFFLIVPRVGSNIVAGLKRNICVYRFNATSTTASGRCCCEFLHKLWSCFHSIKCYYLFAGTEDRATQACDLSADAGAIQHNGLGAI